MRCKIKTKSKDSGFISESLFDYPVTADTIESVTIKRNQSHATMNIRLKAWMGNPFDLYVICTGLPCEIHPTAACVPVGVALDKPRTIADTAMSIYTATPELTDEESQFLTNIYSSQIGGKLNAQ